MSSDASSSRVVIFRIGADLYAVDVQGVERVARYQTPRVLPRLPAWIEGVIELEGRLIPVVDLRRRLTATAMDVGAQTRLLIITMEHDWCAMIVDQVLDVRAYTSEELAPPPALVRSLDGALVRGTLRRGDALVLVLDTARIFSADEQPALQCSPAHA
jgi:purine-binding chemotaxis protein CheW